MEANLNKKLIGGQALRNLGSSRHTKDFDYLINDKEKDLFSIIDGDDYINAAKNSFFKAVWEKEIKNKRISLNSLLELKGYSFVQHCQNFNFDKADNDEFDIKFLVRILNFDLSFNILKKHISEGELSEITKIINGMKK